MSSPYQISNIKSSLIDSLADVQSKGTKSKFATSKQRAKIQEEFEQKLKEAQDRAREKANKNKGLFKGLNILGSFLGPVGASIAKGLSAAGKARQQQLGARELLNLDDRDRFKRNFLSSNLNEYMEQAEDSQVSSGDVLRSGIGGGISGYSMSKMLGGDKATGGLFKKMGQARKMYKKFGGQEQAGAKYLDDILTTKGLSPNIMGSKSPALTQLIESFKGFSKGQTAREATDEMKSAMMLPMLLQLLIGGKD